MAAKNKVLEEALNAYADFTSLCKEFFAKGIDSVTKLDKDSAFYKTAQEIANDFELDWDNLSPEDNNELMIALLEEYYQKVNVDGNFNYTISIKVTEKNPDKTAG